MDYTAWRISFQSGDQAARAAFNELLRVKGLMAKMRADLVAQTKDAEARCMTLTSAVWKDGKPANYENDYLRSQMAACGRTPASRST